MIIKDKTDMKVEKLKIKAGLKGDVYLINGHLMESLASHKKMFPASKASTIEEAELERKQILKEEKAELERLAKLQH